MGRLASFVALSATERRLVVAAAGLLAGIRIGLWVLPFRSVHGAIRAFGSHPRSRSDSGPPVERIVWAVGAADRVVPRTTCLVRALAAQALLARHGHASRLRLGVASGRGQAFEAHAWLEQDGHVLIGGPVEGRYVPLPALDKR
jgi:transglutaminase superfamily protein